MNVNPWIVRSRPQPEAEVRLFCLPHAGGSAAMFFAWPALLPDSVEVVGLQLPGRGRRIREAGYTRMTPLVEAAGEAVAPLLDRPYALFGQSLGALIGFELGRALAGRGRPPQHLFVSACSAPHLHAPDPPLHALPEAEFLAALQRFNGTPREIFEHQELMQQLIPVFRADFAVSETYAYAGGILSCPITAFGGLEDRIVAAESLDGWRRQTEAAFERVMFPGGHFYLPAIQGALLERVSQALGALSD